MPASLLKRPTLPKRPRPPQVPHKTQLPTGPKFLHLEKAPTVVGGPGQPPPGFLNGNNSRSEWPIYWALTLILGPNGVDWSYQGKISGGRKLPGGSVPDFVVWNQKPPLVLRVQTYRYHIGTASFKHTYDFEQRIAMERFGFHVMDLYEADYVNDPTGKAALKVVREALAGIQRPNPIVYGGWRAGRPARFVR